MWTSCLRVKLSFIWSEENCLCFVYRSFAKAYKIVLLPFGKAYELWDLSFDLCLSWILQGHDSWVPKTINGIKGHHQEELRYSFYIFAIKLFNHKKTNGCFLQFNTLWLNLFSKKILHVFFLSKKLIAKIQGMHLKVVWK